MPRRRLRRTTCTVGDLLARRERIEIVRASVSRAPPPWPRRAVTLGVLPPIILDHGSHLVFCEEFFPLHGAEGIAVHWQNTELGVLYFFLEVVVLFVQFLEALVIV